MKRNWTTEELVDSWTLLPNELELIGIRNDQGNTGSKSNKAGPNHLGFALLLKFFQLEARFPDAKNEIPRTVIAYVARQLRVDSETYLRYDWRGRTFSRHRGRILRFFGFREALRRDANEMVEWLCSQVLTQEQDIEHLKDAVYSRFRQLHLVPPAPDPILRLIHSALHTYEERLFAIISTRLATTTKQRLQQLLQPTPRRVEIEHDRPFWLELRHDPGRPGLETALAEIAKLVRLNELDLPPDLFAGLSHKVGVNPTLLQPGAK